VHAASIIPGRPRPTFAAFTGRRNMDEQLAAGLFWLIMLIPVGVFARQILQVRRGTQRKVRATALFFAYSMLPALAYIACFLLLAGAEEVTARPLISEGYARMLVPLVAVSVIEVLVLTLAFGITASLLRVPDTT